MRIRFRPSSLTRTASRSIGRRGLTLFEVLLALLIFVAATATLGQLISSGVRGAVRARLETAAILLCESKLNEILVGVEPFQAAEGEPFPDGEWEWSATIDPGPHPDVLVVTVTVTQSQATRPISFTLARIVRDPQIFLNAESEAAALEAEEE